jgi:hypothetical protein
MKQTATEFLFEKLWETTKDKLTWNAILEQAKEKEKEENVEFARLCLNKAKDLDILTAFMNAQQYYKETYGK